MEIASVEILKEACRRLNANQSFAMVTVVRTSGATPRKEGARMLVSSQGDLFGSIGGSALERIGVEEALKSLETGFIRTVRLNLNDQEGRETGMICGGQIELLIEPFGVTPVVHLFGAGHVAQPTAFLAQKLGFLLKVYDPRPEWANQNNFPDAQITLGVCHELAEKVETRPKDFIIIMTHCHDEDYKVLIRVINKPWFYLGVIGSRKKAVEIREKLKTDGISPELISRISCPIGLSIPTHTPWEIGIAIAGQLIEKLQSLVYRQIQEHQIIFREDAIA